MAKVLITEDYLTDIGDAIREKLDVETTYKVSEMADAIESISAIPIADEYDDQSTYDVGDYVVYENALYKCNTAITTAEEWTSAHWDEVTVMEEVETKADTDGMYEDMSVGNLISSQFVENKEPYLFRRTGNGKNIDGSEKAFIDKIIGATVAWNQLVANSGSVSVTVPSGHKYFSNIGGTKAIAISNGSAISATGGTDNIVDLTAMFGIEIADYIYSLEQTTSGAGVAWLKSYGFLTKDYYAFDSGSLQSVKTSEHRTSGKNLLPMSVSEIKALNTGGTWSGNVYTYWGITFTILTDSDDNIIGIQANGTAGSSNSQFRFYISNLSGDYYFNGCPSGGGNSSYNVYMWDDTTNARPKKWDGTSASASDDGSGASKEVKLVSGHTSELIIRIIANATVNNIVFRPMIYAPSVSDATYEPYHINSYPLDSDLELRGLFKLDANNNLYAEGDVYESSGAVTREYGYRTYQSGDESLADAITDGTNTVYKLTTPTTEQADPFANPQIVSPLGTEEYVDTRDVPIPVGHQTRYMANLKAKIEGLPWDLSMIAPIENGATASQAYSTGQYFLKDNQFCKALTSIASGATFTLNTNYAVTTVANELYTALHS